MHLDAFENEESVVRYYCRKLPNLLDSATGAIVRDIEGRQFIDFLSACGTLNYGHNHPNLKGAALDYLRRDGIIASLDLHTSAKLHFIERFRDVVLKPRGLSYKLQFPGPTGANCVEAAIKLARKVTGRTSVVAFTNAFHGMSLGALALTGSSAARMTSAGLLNGVVRLPYDAYLGAGVADLTRFEAMATDPSGGVDPIAAIVVEAVQGEGGLNVASSEWLQALAATAKRLGSLLIVDDIQAGCGRTGTFFSFEGASIEPDIVCLAKSISGLGLPMSLLLLKRELDVWSPGEHNGTFRGNSLAFVTASAALGLWENGDMTVSHDNVRMLSKWTKNMAARFVHVKAKGRGMMQGLKFSDARLAQMSAASAVQRGVIVECCGPHDEVLKIMPPLNIEPVIFADGLERLGQAISEALSDGGGHPPEDFAAPSQRYETRLDAYDDGSDPVVRPELAHPVA
ncbi:diaminobutyrate--2-oxoglutarate transaminase [Bradyrhizobium sp. CCBAU 53338]|uniref:diaminobutyrate--2-oxoglutarate transaminase n=1 Tax=Bradyrhizobium sp. CCBAU 53338 TaxID=1325111 RepID=UPI00188DA6B4|nr:diaminobutyrate--2-oxoglutarate transaminase [Bradyrhizobium sp. CCBAU 53338]QOZ56065.1 diaminobutyrate--2-oxoglutarate transaminase [Bradyrhizobium sp. CCBAU 53338]